LVEINVLLGVFYPTSLSFMLKIESQLKVLLVVHIRKPSFFVLDLELCSVEKTPRNSPIIVEDNIQRPPIAQIGLWFSVACSSVVRPFAKVRVFLRHE